MALHATFAAVGLTVNNCTFTVGKVLLNQNIIINVFQLYGTFL